MSTRHCWTCNSEHDLDEACRRFPITLAMKAAGAKDSDLFDNAEPASRFGPTFMAEFESEDSCCGEGIVPGEDIRADGHGGWIHADTTCERLASG